MSDTIELEIFRAGAYPQGTFSVADLDQIVARYDPTLHEAPVRLDHNTGPAYGWVESLRREGEVLKAKLKDLAGPFVEAVRAGRFKKRSAEIWTNFKDGPYLKAVAFLGAAIPAVTGLGDVAFADGGESITVTFEEEDSMSKDAVAGQDAPPPVKTFSQLEHEAIVEAERKRAADEALAKFTEAQSDAEKERKRAEAAESRIQKMEADMRRSEIHTFCEELKKDGKLLPAWQEKGIEAFIASLDGRETLTFSETVSVPQEVWFKEFLKNLAPMVPLGERMAAARTPAAQIPELQQKINRQLGLTDDDFAKFGKKEN